MDEQAARDEMAKKGFKNVVLLDWPSDEFHDTHSHEWPVYVRILEGSMTVETAGGKTVCKAGDLLTLPANEPHIERIGPNGIRLLSARG